MLADEVGRGLRDRGYTISVAESCTGGLLGDMITDVPGSSDYFLGGVISYSDDAKVSMLGVDEGVLRSKGAVSQEVAIQMASGVRSKFGSTIGVGITGIAGPSGGTQAKPVGLVFISVCSATSTVCKRHVFDGPRESVKRQAAERALGLVLEFVSRAQ